jgi:AcrR family transcriptional regulator
MDRIIPDVKSRRRYDSSGRRQQAGRNREAILEVARRLFLSGGYAATTVASIAQGSSVSVETIYKAFGGKAGLVRAIYDRGLSGRGAVPAYERSDQMREQETDPETIMRNWGTLTAEVGSVVMPIRLLMRSAAATDTEIAAVLEDSDNQRLDRMRHHASFLSERGYIREGITVDEATDILWTCSSVELYEMLVLKRGWSPARFARFIGEYMIATILPIR